MYGGADAASRTAPIIGCIDGHHCTPRESDHGDASRINARMLGKTGERPEDVPDWRRLTGGFRRDPARTKVVDDKRRITMLPEESGPSSFTLSQAAAAMNDDNSGQPSVAAFGNGQIACKINVLTMSDIGKAFGRSF
jgi:hypothetical protein